jgi:hypothetical protein
MVQSPHFVKSGNPEIAVQSLLSGGSARAGSPEPQGSAYSNSNFQISTADTQVGLFFCWIKYNNDTAVGAGNIFLIRGTVSGRVDISIATTGILTVTGRQADAAAILEVAAAVALEEDVWTAVMMSYDLAATTVQLFFQPLNKAATDVAVVTTATNAIIDADSDGSGTPHSWFGASQFNQTGTTAFSQFLFDTTAFLDLSVAANREKLVTTNGRPVNLGTTGSLTLGLTPDLYSLDGDPLRTNANWIIPAFSFASLRVNGPGESDNA